MVEGRDPATRTEGETLTNLRVVRDEDSSSGRKLTHEPFRG